MLTQQHDLQTALCNYLLLLQKASYFDAHEVLEEAWHPMRKSNHPLSNLIKGLINAAIAFEHLKRNRYNAKRKALTVIASYERHKHLCRHGIAQHQLFDQACKKIEGLKKTNDLFRKPMI